MNNYIFFQIFKNKAMIDIENIQEIIVRPEEMTPIIDGKVYVQGVINLRGEAIPIIDLKLFLGLDSGIETKEEAVLIIKDGDRRLGVVVDKIYYVEELELSKLELLTSENKLYSIYFPKVVRIKDEIISVFNTKQVFEDINL